MLLYYYKQEEYGNELDIEKVGENSIKLFYDSDVFEYFMNSEQVQFWEKRGHPFVKLTSEECNHHIPTLGKITFINRAQSWHPFYGSSNPYIFLQNNNNRFSSFLDEYSR